MTRDQAGQVITLLWCILVTLSVLSMLAGCYIGHQFGRHRAQRMTGEAGHWDD
jgi:hypothetical protein